MASLTGSTNLAATRAVGTTVPTASKTSLMTVFVAFGAACNFIERVVRLSLAFLAFEISLLALGLAYDSSFASFCQLGWQSFQNMESANRWVLKRE
jgi:hypothetical protein